MPASVEDGTNEHYTLAVPKDLAVAVIGHYPNSSAILHSGISRFPDSLSVFISLSVYIYLNLKFIII